MSTTTASSTTSIAADALGTARQTPDRLFYAIGVLLDAEDFEAEQRYHRGRLARALAYLHANGTVAGLEVKWEKGTGDRGERLLVKPGLALDRVGRLIEVPRDACLRLDRWFAGETDAHLIGAFKPSAQGVVADVFVRYVACERGKTPAFATGPFDALDALQPARLRDGYEVTLYPRQEADPPPLPQGAWPALSGGDAAKKVALQDAVFAAWHETDDAWDRDGPKPLGEHVPGQDPTSVFLARLVLPATLPGGGARPVRRADDVVVDNRSRRFVYPPAALARWVGL